VEKNTTRITFILAGILVIAFLRLVLLDFANFAPIAAAGIFGIFFLKKKYWGIILALAAIFLSDLVLSYTKGYSLYSARIIDYFGLAIGLGFAWWILRSKQTMIRAIGAASIGSLAFFVISNFGVWMMGNLYPKTLGGLLTCYEMAIPFYRGTLIGDIFFTTLFVGAFQLLTAKVPQLQMEDN